MTKAALNQIKSKASASPQEKPIEKIVLKPGAKAPVTTAAKPQPKPATATPTATATAHPKAVAAHPTAVAAHPTAVAAHPTAVAAKPAATVPPPHDDFDDSKVSTLHLGKSENPIHDLHK